MHVPSVVIAPLLLAVFLGAARGQWVQSTGPRGTSVRTLGAAGGTLFIGTWDRVFLSGDQGRSWSTDSGLAIHGNILLFNGEYYCGTPSGVRKRPVGEGRRPWTPAGLANRNLLDMAGMGPYLFALSPSAVFRSPDPVAAWDSLSPGIPNRGLTALLASDDALFLGTTRNGVYRSLDSGKTWTATGGSLDTLYVTRLAGTGPALYALAKRGLHGSTDGGATWRSIAVDTANGYPVSLAVRGADLYVGTFAGWVLRSADQGSTWTRAQASPSEWPIHTVTVNGADIFAATTTEAFRSSDQGTTWTPVDLRDVSIGDFVSLDGDLFASSSGTGFHRSRDNGANWTVVNRGLRTDASVYDMTVLGEHLLAATSWHVFRSSDRGASWQQYKTGLPAYPYFTSIFPSRSGLYVGSDEGLFRSLDSGQTWRRAGDSAVNRIWSGPMAEMGRHLLLGTYILRPGSGGIYRSSDGGNTWTRSESGMPPLKIRALIAKDGFFFAAVGADTAGGTQPIGMYRSADSGATWTVINHGLSDLNIGCVVTVQGALVVGTRKGAFRSLDNGDSWTLIGDDNIPPIYSLAASGPYLVAGVEKGSAWRLPISQVTAVRSPDRPRAGTAGRGTGRDYGRQYDIRGKDATEDAAHTWKIRKPK